MFSSALQTDSTYFKWELYYITVDGYCKLITRGWIKVDSNPLRGLGKARTIVRAFPSPQSPAARGSNQTPSSTKQKHRLSAVLLLGGGRWIRTTEGIASRFTVCPLWPLGNSPIFSYRPFALSNRSPAQRVRFEKEDGGSIVQFSRLFRKPRKRNGASFV